MFLLNKVIGFTKLTLNLIFQIIPINDNAVLFISFEGQYNDNPKYISEALHEIGSTKKIYWATSGKSNENLPDYIKPIKYNSIKFRIIKASSKVVVDNYIGLLSTTKTKPVNFFIRSQKRKGQFNISTWHGTPLKKARRDLVPNAIESGFFTTSDLITSGSKYNSEMMKHYTFNKVKILEVGSPRNDILFNITEEKRNELLTKLKLKKDIKYVLFAPTFRTDIEKSGIDQMNSFDFETLFDTLELKFGSKWALIYRIHHSVFKKINFEKYKRFESRLVNGNQFDDMSEYLAISDVLITDYSSSFFDFMITKRPCFFYCLDFENYSKVERGLYFDMKVLPYPFATSFEELLQSIREYDISKRNELIEQFLERINTFEKGEAALRVARIIDRI